MNAPVYVQRPPEPSRALALFREGKSTHEVALLIGTSEALASRYIWVARCREKGLPADFYNASGEIKRIAP
jgi:transposase